MGCTVMASRAAFSSTQPPPSGINPLDAQHMAVFRVVQERLRGLPDLRDTAPGLEEIQRGKRLVLVKMQLDVACLPPAAAIHAGKISGCQRVPVPAQHIVRAKAAGTMAAGQCAVQVVYDRFRLAGRGQLRAAHDDKPGTGGLGGQQVVGLRGKLVFQLGVHNGNDTAQRIPAVQRLVPQNVVELVHVKDAARLNETRSKPRIAIEISLVRIRRWWVSQSQPPLIVSMSQCSPIRSCSSMASTFTAPKSFSRTADAVPLRDEILHVAAQERRLAGAEKPSDQIDLYHFTPPSGRSCPAGDQWPPLHTQYGKNAIF